MAAQKDIYTGEPGVLSALNVLIVILWLVFASFLSGINESHTFGQLAVALLPLALAFFWYSRIRIKNSVVKITPESISLERKGKVLGAAAWHELQNAEFSIGRKGLDVFDTSGQLKLHIPQYFLRFDELTSTVSQQVTAQYHQKPRTQFFQRTNVRNDFIGWVTAMVVMIGYLALIRYTKQNSFDDFVSAIQPLLIISAIFLFHSIRSAWRSPKHITFHSDKLEIVTAWRRIQIPYTDITKAELIPNSWAPVSANRNFLKIHRKGTPKSYTVKGLELNSEQLLQRVRNLAVLS